jgi:serine phosphatase RsbU (regulator of sigma subunit)
MAAMTAASSSWIEWGVAGRALTGEGPSGDLHMVAAYGDGVVVGVADGLGHGPAAAEAARAAADVFERNAGCPVVDLMTLCHEALRHTRGAVLSLARFDAAAATVEWLGVGNVEGVLIRASRTEDPSARSLERDFLLLRGGVVGFRMPSLRPATLSVRGGDVLILATDGIRRDFAGIQPGTRSAQALAEEILGQHRRGSDDALALVVRYLDGS